MFRLEFTVYMHEVSLIPRLLAVVSDILKGEGCRVLSTHSWIAASCNHAMVKAATPLARPSPAPGHPPVHMPAATVKLVIESVDSGEAHAIASSLIDGITARLGHDQVGILLEL